MVTAFLLSLLRWEVEALVIAKSGAHQIALYSFRGKRKTFDKGSLGLQACAWHRMHFLRRYLWCVQVERASCSSSFSGTCCLLAACQTPHEPCLHGAPF